MVYPSDLEALTYEEAVELQIRMASIVSEHDSFEKYELFCGVDVAYSNQHAVAVAVIQSKDGSLLEVSKYACVVRHAYVPGLLFLREAPPMLNAIKGLKNDFDVLLIDGNGRLHPRKFGIACYIGIVLDKPTIGVAKRLLCGQVKMVNGKRVVVLNGDVVGEEVASNVYVSVGHKISLSTAVKIVKELMKGDRLPSPILAAHRIANDELRRKDKV